MSIQNNRENRSQRFAKRFFTILFVLMLLMTPVMAFASTAWVGPMDHEVGETALIWLDGPAQANPGELISYNITTDAIGLYGAELNINFDPAVLQVVGTEITPGSCPTADFVVTNSVDNGTGTISYAVTSLNPTEPCNGGIVASFQFQVSPAAAEGITPVQFGNVILADNNGVEIPVTAVDFNLDIVVEPGLEYLLYLPVILKASE